LANGETYAESNYWSQRHKQWKLYNVAKPRLPVESDTHDKWIEKYIPQSLSLFKGPKNSLVRLVPLRRKKMKLYAISDLRSTSNAL